MGLDTGVVSAMREGMTGIFMPIKYNEDSYIEMNKANQIKQRL